MKDFYNLCWDCYEKNADYYLELWYNDIAGHAINCFKCEICGKGDAMNGEELETEGKTRQA
jgi:hypothetical protein